MSRPATADLPLWRGSNNPIAWRFRSGTEDAPVDLDLTGDTLLLTIRWRGTTQITKNSTGGDGLTLVSYLTIDPLSGASPVVLDTLVWTPTLAETRSIPLGRVAEYEIERRAGTSQTVLLAGRINADGGVNADA